jgi:hypothetical protein
MKSTLLGCAATKVLISLDKEGTYEINRTQNLSLLNYGIGIAVVLLQALLL